MLVPCASALRACCTQRGTPCMIVHTMSVLLSSLSLPRRCTHAACAAPFEAALCMPAVPRRRLRQLRAGHAHRGRRTCERGDAQLLRHDCNNGPRAQLVRQVDAQRRAPAASGRTVAHVHMCSAATTALQCWSGGCWCSDSEPPLWHHTSIAVLRVPASTMLCQRQEAVVNRHWYSSLSLKACALRMQLASGLDATP